MEIESKVKRNFGFGCMRLPMLDNNTIDLEQFKKMVDYFILNGFNYFDTAHMYHNGLSEVMIKEAIAKRYNREEYVLTNKLSNSFFESYEDIKKIFDLQLDVCGVEYFDFYLMHALNKNSYEKYNNLHAFDFAIKEKEKGRIKHIGISFHDKHDVLDKILMEHPEIEVVQLQFNYLDFENPNVESRLNYEICLKYDKTVIVMEPVRGGALSNLPNEANEIIDLKNYSASSYALRFAASFKNIKMVLSGMSNMAQMEDNVKTFSNFKLMDDIEKNKLYEIVELIYKLNRIECTACSYCTTVCPKNIDIPSIFKALNDKKIYHSWWAKKKYDDATTGEHNKASECLKCGKCETICPQNLEIRKHLVEAKNIFEGE